MIEALIEALEEALEFIKAEGEYGDDEQDAIRENVIKRLTETIKKAKRINNDYKE